MRRTLAVFVLFGRFALAQETPAFEAADVHASASGSTESGGFLPNGRLEFRATTLLRLIVVASGVPPERVAGGPSWLDTDRFDVVAKAAGPASQPALRNMLQGLLEQRFDLKLDREEKPLPVFVLTLFRPGAQKESSGAADPECRAGTEDNQRTLTCRHTTMAALAERLPAAAPAYFNRPVVDRTGLSGSYDFKLGWLGRGQVASVTDAGSIFTSLEKQLGVKVESQTAPLPVLTIAHVNRTPAPNPPGSLEKLGPPPTEFDAADLKPSRPGANEDFEINNGRIRAQAILLKDLIAFAYDVEEDWVRGGEKWLESDRFDIAAKTAPTASADTLRVMLQSLLAERFKLKVHKEPQPVTVYALTVGKSKLKDADPASRSTCKTGNADGLRAITCTNTTMAQLAVKLPDAGAGYIDHPVVDLTGLNGSYDFTASWTPKRRLLGPAGANPPSGDDKLPADRPVGLTIFEAIDRQLGLKLATRKHPMPVLIVDHIERKPAEN